ncbi:hypothetical protein KKE99_02565 [Patescibacteria group bacterium]|nr:hypothetical protein [Patescibacteria group bacterium]
MAKSKKQFIFLAAAVFLFFGAAFPGCSSKAVPKDAGVFKSIDGGLTWERKIQIVLPPESKEKTDLSDKDIISFGINPDDSNIVYAGSSANGLFRSKDAGENWESFNGASLTSIDTIYYIAIDRKNIKNMYLSGVSAYGKGRVMKSEDEGETWQEVYVTLTAGEIVNRIEIDLYDTSIVYITTTKGQIFQSANYGRSWTALNRLTAVVDNFTVTPKDTRILYITSGNQGLFKSTDKGNNWLSINENLAKVAAYKARMKEKKVINVIALDPLDINVIYVGFLNGMIKSSDGGNTWSVVNIITPPAVLPMNSLVVSQKDSKSIYYTIDSQVYFTNNGAESNWLVRNLPTSRVITALTIDPNDSKTIYVGTVPPPVKKSKF